jgi:hypothetical protein
MAILINWKREVYLKRGSVDDFTFTAMFHLWFHARAWKINYNALHHFCASLGQIE